MGWWAVLFVFWATAGDCLRLRFDLWVAGLGFGGLDDGLVGFDGWLWFLVCWLFVGTV